MVDGWDVWCAQGSDMDADDDEFITANNDGYGLDDDDILTRWEDLLPPGIYDLLQLRWLLSVYLSQFQILCNNTL